MNKPIMALSIRQPWAWAITHAGKDVENRKWPTRYRGFVFIHAGAAFDGPKADVMDDIRHWAARAGVEPPSHIDLVPRGGIVGIAEVVDCVTDLPASRWFCGPYGFVLRNARPMPFIPCKGHLGFFPAPQEALELANTKIGETRHDETRDHQRGYS